MKIVIFTEAGSEYGYGHLMRCLALAQGFKERSIDVKFAIRGDGEFKGILDEFPYTQIEWMNRNNLEDFQQISDISIVDSYYASEDLCTQIYKEFKRALFIDDYNRLTYPGGFVLNGVIGADKLDYPENPEIVYLLGTGYQPLRKEFWDVPEYVVRDSIKNIMITFGGSDLTNETPHYIGKILNYYPNSDLRVIIGNGFNNANTISKQYEKDKRIHLIYHPEALEMREIMLHSDLAVSAAGQTISELARVGVPTIGIQVAENQKNNIHFWQESEFLLPAGILGEDITSQTREKSSNIGRSLIDGQGVTRIVEAVL